MNSPIIPTFHTMNATTSIDETLDKHKISWFEDYVLWPTERFWENVTSIPRKIKWFIQRGRRGWADCDLWSLDEYLAQWLPDALLKLKEDVHGWPEGPDCPTFESWQQILVEMADGFKAEQELGEGILDEKERDKINKRKEKGLNLFVKYFSALWD